MNCWTDALMNWQIDELINWPTYDELMNWLTDELGAMEIQKYDGPTDWHG